MMQSPILEQISTQRLDYSTYGRLPIAEDIYVIEEKDPELKKKKAVLDQFKKLKYIQKNLRILDMYIQQNKGEPLQDWLVSNKHGMSKNVLSKIGKYNNVTGGISLYFFNLQNFYDEEEAIYDRLEASSNLPVDLSKAVPSMRQDREKKRANRGKCRKIMLKDLKSDGKGYIEVDLGEAKKEDAPSELLNADGLISESDPESQSTEKTNVTMEPEPTDANKEKLEKATSNIHIWIAGTIVVVTAISVGIGLYSAKQ